MKRIIKSVIGLFLVAALLFVTFGCSKNEVIQTGVLEEGYVPNPSGKVRLQYYCATNEASKRSVNDWVATFQSQYPKVEVQTEFIAGDIMAVPAQLAAKSIGDVFFLNETVVYDYAVNQNVLMPLDSFIEAYGVDTSAVFSAIYNMGVIEGKTYMIMRDYNHISLIYNKDLIKSANLEDPVALDERGEWDWETFKTYCKALTTEPGSDTNIVGADLRLGYAPVYLPILEGWGGKWYDTENKKIHLYSDQKVLEGLNDVVEFVKSNSVRVSGVNESPSQRSFAGYEPVFRDAVFLQMASYGNEYESKGTDWDVVSFPAFPTHKVGTGATGFVVYNRTLNADAAAALCLSLYSEAGQRAYNGQEGGSVPNVKTLADQNFWRVPFDDKSIDPENGKNYNAWISYPEADTYGQTQCILPPDIANLITGELNSAIVNAVNGNKSMADILSSLETRCNQKWETLYKGN